MIFSNTQIDKLGGRIKQSYNEKNSPNEEDIKHLQQFRIKHQKELKATFDFLVTASRYSFKGSVVVYRLKRIDTILRKISRYPTMRLSKMQDIGGCRAIVQSENQILKIKEAFNNSNKFDIIHEDNYLSTPRKTGYMSYHIIVKPKNLRYGIEIQLRTKRQHHWATLVEITDLIYGIKLKEGADHQDLYFFHKMLSLASGKLNIEQSKKLIEIEKKHSIIARLLDIFKSNYFITLKNWIKSVKNMTDNYVIMIVNKEFEPEFQFFNNLNDAESKYFRLFTTHEPNMVLIHLIEPDFEKVGLAYSNYVLTNHPSVQYYLELLREQIINMKRENYVTTSNEYYKYYQEIYDRINNELMVEFTNFFEISIDNEKLNTDIKILKDWGESMQIRFKELAKDDEVFREELSQINTRNLEENNIFKRFINWIED